MALTIILLFFSHMGSLSTFVFLLTSIICCVLVVIRLDATKGKHVAQSVPETSFVLPVPCRLWLWFSKGRLGLHVLRLCCLQDPPRIWRYWAIIKEILELIRDRRWYIAWICIQSLWHELALPIYSIWDLIIGHYFFILIFLIFSGVQFIDSFSTTLPPCLPLSRWFNVMIISCRVVESSPINNVGFINPYLAIQVVSHLKHFLDTMVNALHIFRSSWGRFWGLHLLYFWASKRCLEF